MLNVTTQHAATQPRPSGAAIGNGENPPVAAAEDCAKTPRAAQKVSASETKNAYDAAAATEFNLPADAQQTLSELGELTKTDETIAKDEVTATDDGTETLTEVTVIATAEAAPEITPEATAEQWLLSMLGQQSTQISARDFSEARNVSEARDGVQSIGAADVYTSLPVNNAARQSLSQTSERLPEEASTIGVANLGRSSAAEKVAHLFASRTPESAQAIESLSSDLTTALNSLTDIAATPAADAPASNASTPANSISHAPVLERSLRMQGNEAKWGEQLLHALRDNVDVQLQQRVQNATIRLDPPELGSMEIFLSHESGRLSVHISATQVDVARLLQSTSERLRQELVGQNFMQVSVEISSGGQPGQQHAQQQGKGLFGDETAIADSRETELPIPEKTRQRSDILVTV
jgi:flagellar hook-length control protein FliK